MRPDFIDYINSLSWVHSIELPYGIITPGRWGLPNKALLSFFDTIDFKGKSVLDIGCWDGLWAFEAEKRGATMVYATDDVSQRPLQDQLTFAAAHEFLQSKVIYEPMISVYEIDKLAKRDFDIVLFFGVYYHLKHPLYAFSKLRKMLGEGGLLLLEGPAFQSRRVSYAKFYYHKLFQNDATIWWVPTLKCIREMIECSFFEITREVDTSKLRYSRSNPLYTVGRNAAMAVLNQKFPKRYIIEAKAVSKGDFNYWCPDTDLIQYDKNDYREVPFIVHKKHLSIKMPKNAPEGGG